MTPRRSRLLTAAALLTASALTGGCVAAAAIAPSAVGASPVVVENLGSGRGDSFWMARYDDVVEAALRAGEVLSLELTEEQIGEDSTRLRFMDERDALITLRIERRTETVTQIRVFFGSSRNSGLGALLGRQIIEELEEADAFLVDWSDAKVPRAPRTE
ncbi:MAG: DUF3568 family protein [Kiloniellales bacterium]|nr:DUF3568 family protein [Kiloniellales bacterium]